MRTTNEIDKESASIKEKVKKLESNKKHALESLDKITRTRQENAFNALSGNDPKAQQKLEKARADQIGIQLQVEDFDSAIIEARQKLHALEVERQRIFIEEKKVEFAELGKTAVQQSEKIDDALSSLVTELLVEHNKVIERMQRIATQLGYRRNFNLDRFRRCLYGRLHKSFSRDFNVHPEYRQDFVYAERLSRLIKNAIAQPGQPELEDDEQTAEVDLDNTVSETVE